MRKISSINLTSKSFAWWQVAVLLLSALMPTLLAFQPAQAASLANRELRLSSSANGTLADGQNVTYEWHFDYTSTSNVGSVQFEYCSNSPLIGDACTAPTGFDADDATGLTLSNQTNETGFSIDTAASDVNTTCLTRTAEAVTAGADSEYEFTSVDNPENANTTFYGRIRTFISIDCTGAETDSGGVAVSTTAQLVVTARVQENIVFCIYTGANCAAGGTAVTLGDTTNGVLSDTQDYHDPTADFDVRTNGQGGVVVRMKGSTLTSGANTISAIGATATVSTPGSEQFGLCVATSGGSVASLEPYTGINGADNCADDLTDGTYDDNADFAFDTAAMGTFGDDIASSSSTSNTTVGTLNFLGNIAITTESGIYTTTLTFIATATY